MRFNSDKPSVRRGLYRSLRSRLRTSQRGSVSAELAITFPLVITILMIGVGTLSLSGNQLRLEQILAAALRSGSESSAVDYIRSNLDESTVTSYREGGRRCLRVESKSQIPLLGQWFVQQAELCFP